MPSLAAALDGPDTRPRGSAGTAPIISYSSGLNLLKDRMTDATQRSIQLALKLQF
jgi:hypothetical protein